MTGLLLIRHGPTAWNRAGRIQGRSDQPLDPDGRREVATWRLPEPFQTSLWVTSPLARARETAAILGHGEAEIAEELIETDWGDWEGQSLADLRRQLGAEMARLESLGLDFRPPGGESPRQVQARVLQWCRELPADDATVAAVTHKGVIRAVYAAASGWDMLGKPPHKLDWAAAHLFAVDGEGAIRVDTLNLPLSESGADPGR